MSKNVSAESEKLHEYIVEASDLARGHEKESKILMDLTKEVAEAADFYVMRQTEKGKECNKKQAIEKVLKDIGLGRFRAYFKFGELTPQQAVEIRKFVLSYYETK